MSHDRGLTTDSTTGVTRCWWCGHDSLYVDYHDQEWGRPVADDQQLFEKICLEGFQAGLSWLTILRKRPNFREAFCGFEIQRVARFTPAKVEKLVGDPGIVRHRGKIVSTINNARCAQMLIQEYGSLAAYFWQFEAPHSAKQLTQTDIRSETAESRALSKDLKRRGWTFVGPTTCYAFMQAMGMVNDHLYGCAQWESVERARACFSRPYH